MTPETWQRVEAIVTVALGLPIEGRPEFLKIACRNESALRDQVDRLMSGYRAQEGMATATGLVDRNPEPSDRSRRSLRKPLGRERLGSWTLHEVISRGGMGVVFSAKRSDGLYDQDVAVKILSVDLLDTAAEEWFDRERRVLARLNHPGIVKVFDGGATTDGRPFIVMERVDGLPIDRHCATYNLTQEDRLRLFIEVCKAVEYAHEKAVIHRDLKPSNILVDRYGHPRILDFGIAKSAEGSEPPAALTNRQAMTLAYASPEQIRGLRCTVASDVYSLGVVLYELLTGRKPFNGRSLDELRRSILSDSPIAPCGAYLQNDGLCVNSLTLRCLERLPGKRYPTVANLRLDLEKVLKEREVLANDQKNVRISPPEVPMVSRTTVVPLVILLLAGMVAWVLLNFVVELRTPEEASRTESSGSRGVIYVPMPGNDPGWTGGSQTGTAWSYPGNKSMGGSSTGNQPAGWSGGVGADRRPTSYTNPGNSQGGSWRPEPIVPMPNPSAYSPGYLGLPNTSGGGFPR